MFGGGHNTTFTDTVFKFEFDSLEWHEDYPPTPCVTRYMNKSNFHPSLMSWKTGPAGPYPRPLSSHTYDMLAVADDLPELVLLSRYSHASRSCPPGTKPYAYGGEPRVAHYQLTTKSWHFSDTSIGTKAGRFPAAEYDPISGMILVVGGQGLIVYDPIRKTSALTKKRMPPMGIANQLVYYPPTDRMYYFAREDKKVLMLKLDRDNLLNSTFEQVVLEGEFPTHRQPGFAYDAVNRIIGGAVENNRFHIFDPASTAWSSRTIAGSQPGTMAFHAIAYDPVNNVFIFLTEDRHTWAYRYRLGTAKKGN